MLLLPHLALHETHIQLRASLGVTAQGQPVRSTPGEARRGLRAWLKGAVVALFTLSQDSAGEPLIIDTESCPTGTHAGNHLTKVPSMVRMKDRCIHESVYISQSAGLYSYSRQYRL